jgi:DNA-binding Lrp family transcriptional regulator
MQEGFVSTLYAQVRQMEEAGLIKKAGPIVAFTLVSIKQQVGGKVLSQVDIAKRIARHPEVEEVYIITGDYDLLLKVKTDSIRELGKFIVETIREIKGVDKTYTCLVFGTVKGK